MPGFNPFDMDFDGDVDGIDFLGFHYLTRQVLQPDEEAEDGWGDDHKADDDHEQCDMDEDGF